MISTSALEAVCTFEEDLRSISHFRRLPVAGLMGRLVDLRIIDNYSPNLYAQRISTENLGASGGIAALYEARIDIYRISEMLSAGMLGRWERRRIIPTKSSIVTIKNVLASYLLSKVTKCPTIESFEVFYCGYLDTTYAVLIMPGYWGHEQIRSAYLEGDWRVESQMEMSKEKPSFPGHIGGSYFFGRFVMAECLHKRQRQGKVLLFREVRDPRSIAVGAWQVLESLRYAFKKRPQCFGNLKDALKDILTNLKMPSKLWYKNSRLLSISEHQATLDVSKN